MTEWEKSELFSAGSELLFWPGREKLRFFTFCHILFLPGRKKLKFCSYPAQKSSSFVLTRPKKTHILFRLGPEKLKFLPTKGHFLPMEGVLGWKNMINHLIMTQSNPPYRFLRSLDCPFNECWVYSSEYWVLSIEYWVFSSEYWVLPSSSSYVKVLRKAVISLRGGLNQKKKSTKLRLWLNKGGRRGPPPENLFIWK